MTEAIDLGGQVAIVTGGGRGVGRGISERFLDAGAQVVVCSRTRPETLPSNDEGEAAFVACDVREPEQIARAVAEVKERFGRLDVLVNNAGMTHFIAHTDLDAVTDAIWDEIFQVNLKGAFYCARAAMPLLKAAGGSVVNVSSVAGLTGMGSSIPYCASKAALNCLTQSLARAFGPEVRVNAVAPGPINTRWLAGKEEQVARYLEQAPLGRAAEPDDIADAVVYLATGTTLTTGQVMVVDGGRTM
jgi:3-oxoacyl-[acyl-carrier protein] reductase